MHQMKFDSASGVILENALAHNYVADTLKFPVGLEVDAGRGRRSGRIFKRAALDKKTIDGDDAHCLTVVVVAHDFAKDDVAARPAPLS